MQAKNSNINTFSIQREETSTQASQSERNSEINKNIIKDKVNFKWLLKSCIEEALSFFLEWVPSTITLIFIKNNYPQNIINGFGLGLVWSNCIGQGLYYGLSSGLETMASHEHGAGNYNQVGILFQKTLYISFLMFIPISLSMYFSENIISLWNRDIYLSYIAGQYCIYQIPGIFFTAIYYAYKATLNAQNEYRIQVYSSGSNLILTILYCYIFISKLDLGIYGASIVFSSCQISNLLLCYLFAKQKKDLQKCFIPFNSKCFNDISYFLKTAIPIGSLVALEWMLQEANSIIASNLPSQQYAAHIILANLICVCNQFPLGYATASCTFISNEMGKGNIHNANKYAQYSFIIITFHLMLTLLPVYLLQNQIADIFAVDDNVKQSIILIFNIFIIQYCFDCFQCMLTAYMRAIAQERFSSASFIFCYAFVGLGLSYFLAYYTSFQIQGIWIGITIGLGLYVVMQIVKLQITDLKEMAQIIYERICSQQNNQYKLMNDDNY
ncbi:MatE efflux family protein, putative [Ichthyophthirius multifiliis]|uniref:MatE efflux family protein, putative n=1 Tax=Ichthyophthirius multifiliis TaxID=5932 RepID=G0QTB5_ICHMU|nr:MatE efflux family protein, putative [Ichthyophthirius multifiliis]EGR31550.1 MatE efflux family protein, putative [Ichthyophthirius multifiliis]|eukprot:XP_004035036.1 MatE efflux family protein, putative [Ichthyophthirius multifiliis]